MQTLMREQQVRPRKQRAADLSGTGQEPRGQKLWNKFLVGQAPTSETEALRGTGSQLADSRRPGLYARANEILQRIGTELSPSSGSRLWQVWDELFAPSRIGFLIALVVLAFGFLYLGMARPSSIFFASSGLDTASFVVPDEDSFFLHPYTVYRGDEDAAFSGYTEVDTSKFAQVSINRYTVASGDTLSDIALRFGLKMDTLISYNQISNVRRMQIGTVLNIPSRDGLSHTVAAGQTLESIGRQYGISVNAILDANNLTSSQLAVGTKLFIPDARMNRVDLALAIGELFLTPTVGYLSSYFGYRPDPFTGQRRYHNGIDLANARGTAIRAALPGRVVHIESQTGNYGKFIIIQHDRGFQTLYGHLDSFLVTSGQYVEQGQIIGRMGSTGRSTGPHLHFSVIRNGTFVNPLDYLRL